MSNQEVKNKDFLGFFLITNAARGELELVQDLVENQNADPNFKDYDLRTALHLAAEEGHLEIVKYLVEQGAEVNAVDRWYTSVVRGAIRQNRKGVVEYLKDNGGSTLCEEWSKLEDGDDNIKLEERREKMVRIFQSIDPEYVNKMSKCRLGKFFSFLNKRGLETNKKFPTLMKTIEAIMDDRKEFIERTAFEKMVLHQNNLVVKAFDENLAIPNWENFCEDIRHIFEEVRKDVSKWPKEKQGKNADYIPELKEFDEELFGCVICTIDGQILKIGDYGAKFPIESCVKPLVYSQVVDKYGYDYVHKYVGREPSGVAFNAFTLNYENKPHNACINSGAITICGLYERDSRPGERYKTLKRYLEELSGTAVQFNQSVFLSERESSHGNLALAHYMSAKGSFPTKTMTELSETLDFYFQSCSIDVTCYSAARMAVTLANRGKNPFTGKQVCSPESARRTAQLCFAAGMYDSSGEWACTVGCASKSGVGGLIFTMIPDVGAIAVYSPPLDRNGNSVKGVELLSRICSKYKWSLFNIQ